PGCLLIVFTTLYTLTASPDVQAGDSAEFQLVAAIGGVAHPTTYPLYTLLAQLTTWIIPFGTVAWRVTMLSVLCAAGAVALASVVLRRLGMSHPAALLGALVLGVTPGVWNAATIAEVYALLLLLSMGFAYALCRFATQPSQRHAHAVVLIGVLGCLHHGLFVSRSCHSSAWRCSGCCHTPTRSSNSPVLARLVAPIMPSQPRTTGEHRAPGAMCLICWVVE
ncbi:MAG: DUF2723 domain-containing protein, partial [Chloroflexaceae bacterium]|nr:DUF2723 domain-containing protein [Chloroflexaceae bacterium]